MWIVRVVLLVCLASSQCFSQAPSSSSSSEKWQPAQIMAVKVHQPTGDDDSQVKKYDVTVRVADAEYVVLYTPPPGMDVVEYQLGRDSLAVIEGDTIKWNDMLGTPREAPILSRRSIPPTNQK